MLLQLPTRPGKFKCLLFCPFLFVSLISAVKLQAQAPVSGTFTINSGLPSAGTNFQTFTEAVFSLANGVNGPVVFNVAPGSGPYNEQVNINPVTGASAANTITFNGNGRILEYASNNPISRAVLKLDGANYIIINNLVINPLTTNTAGSYGWGVGIMRDADNNVIKNCTINIGPFNALEPQGTIGIFMGGTDDYPNTNGLSNCDNNLIDSNTITGGYDAIDLNNFAGNFGLDYTPVNNNRVTNNIITGFVNSAINMIWTKNTLIQGNDISATITQNCYGIHADERNSNIRINGNRIHNISSAVGALDANFKAISLTYVLADAASINTISNNLIYDIRNANDQEGINLTGSSWANVYHNTVVLDGPGGGSGIITAGFRMESGNTKVNFENNIISIQRAGSSTGYGINVVNAPTAFVSDYNDIITGAPNSFGRNISTSYATLALWQTGTLQDAHSASQDPGFTSLATGNLKPTNAAIDNLGIFAGIAYDVVAAPRNNIHPDAGAYEFLTPPCGLPVIAGTVQGIPAMPLCGGTTRTLNLSGNSFGVGQTYQWQSSAAAAGPFTNVGAAAVVPVFDIFPPTDLYYRAIVTCSGFSDTSAAGLIKIRHPMTGSFTINSALATDDTNFRNFADVITALNCGIAGPVVLNVTAGSGPYNEQLTIPPIPGASASNTITINGNGETLTYLSTITGDRSTLKLLGADYIIIDNLTITAQGSASGQYGFALHLMNGADHNIIRNCKVNATATSTSSNFAGIVINGSDSDPIGGTDASCDYNKITGNTINGGYYGIIISTDPAASKLLYDTISNNIITNQYVYGIQVRGTDHALVEGNDISRPTRTNTGTYIGIYLNGVSTSLAVSKNKIHATHTAIPAGTDAPVGISSNNCDAPAGSENIISNNLIYDFGARGVLVGINNTGSDSTRYYYNTISFDVISATAPTTTARAFFQGTTATGLVYKNNIVNIKRNGSGTNHGIYMNTNATTFVASNNDYNIAGTGTNRTGFKNAINYTTVADWQTGSGTDAGSLSLEPIFQGSTYVPANIDMDNKGTPIAGITTDLAGSTRNASTPDMGAYEFIGTIPVRLLSITATKTVNDVLVKWITATELNTKHFEIQRSTDAMNFVTAGTVQAKGNSVTNQYYNFTDLGALITTAPVLYYRLKTVDIDGRVEYSVIVPVQLGRTQQLTVSVQPNPFVAELYARIGTATGGKLTIRLNDVAGRLISSQSQTIGSGTSLISIDHVGQLQKGIYLVSIELDGNTYVQKLVK